MTVLKRLWQRFSYWLRGISIRPLDPQSSDPETAALAKNPQFLAILEESRTQKGQGGLSLGEMEQWLQADYQTDRE